MSDIPPTKNGVSLREFFEGILREQGRAVSAAEVEREKAASALRIELERARKEGDDRLRDHISNQISQIRGDLQSADRLEVERVNKALEAIDSLRRELAIYERGSKEAIQKAEAATEKRFESVNEFRGALTSQTANFLTKENADTLIAGVKAATAADEKRITTLETLYAAEQGRQKGVGLSAGVLVGGLGVAAAVIAIVVGFTGG